MSSEKFEIRPAEEMTPAPADPFAPENLRLDQSFAESVGVKKVLMSIPVRRPGAQDFIRVHPDPTYRANVSIIELRDAERADREQYIVSVDLVPALATECVAKTLYLATSRQGSVFFWPVRLPPPEGRNSEWWRTGREAAELAMRSWVRVKPNMKDGHYDVFQAESVMAEPEWPALDFWALVKIAFRDHLVDRVDHPVIKKLRGQS
jgi:hypothetical protein